MTGNTIDATEAQAAEIGGGLVRIEVTEQTARHSWQHHRRFGNILPRNADDLESSARERGSNPEQWRISYHDVPLANFVSIEAYSDGEWTEAARRNDAGEWLMAEWLADAIRAAGAVAWGQSAEAASAVGGCVVLPPCDPNIRCRLRKATNRRIQA